MMKPAVLVLAVLATGGAVAQSQTDTLAKWTARTPDGQPDLQGTWVNFDSTPFEADTSLAQSDLNPPSHWTDHDSPMSAKRRSMVVDPPEGRVPVQKWAEDKRDYDLAHLEDAPWHETPWVRCITRGMPAGMFPAGYNNAYQIVQIPGYVVMAFEMIHETRIIPLDGSPHLNNAIRLWDGDPRGHFEGNTLVVETTNFNGKGSVATSAATGRMRGIPQSEEFSMVERFTRIDENTINYSVTVTDPKVYTQPWSVALPLNRDEHYQMFEYACHEGNLALPGELRAGRMREQAAKAKVR
jgi:hypothetical protein